MFRLAPIHLLLVACTSTALAATPTDLRQGDGSTIASATVLDDNAAMRRRLFDFRTAESVADWRSMDDRVMGGVSRSSLRHDSEGHAVFDGDVSLENNGGFASVRSRPFDSGAAGAVAFVIEVQGDGKRYKLSLRTDAAFDGIAYQASFVAPAAGWSLIRLPLAAFRPSFRGRHVADAPALDPSQVRQLGLSIADRQAGAFALGLRSIGVE